MIETRLDKDRGEIFLKLDFMDSENLNGTQIQNIVKVRYIFSI